MIRVILPHHLRTLAQVGSEVSVDIQGPATLRSVLDGLEARYPMLSGTIRDHERDSDDRSCDFSHARKICPTYRKTPPCLTRSHREQSPSLS